MPGTIYKQQRLQGLDEVALAMFADLKLAGFTQVLPATGQNLTLSAGKGKFVMESAAAVNPLQATQPYRILVDVDGVATGGFLKVAIANPEQISNTGTTTTFPGGTDTTGARIMGQLGAAWNKASGAAYGDAFITRNINGQTYDAGTTYSYLMVATDRGLSFAVWEEASDADPRFSWFSVQVPVNKDDGSVLNDLNTPIFCVYSADTTNPMKFIVSESDVFRPTQSKPASVDSVNSAAIINSQDQVSIARDNRYLVSFPNRLNTDRYAYTEELDMIAYCSADVIGEDSEIPVRVYGEAEDRIYRALKANKANNAGMRLLFLVEGGGVPAA